MLASPQLLILGSLVPPPGARPEPHDARRFVVPALRKHVHLRALAADQTPEALAELCMPVQQAIADMQATQLLVLCWCLLASQLILYAFDKHDSSP